LFQLGLGGSEHTRCLTSETASVPEAGTSSSVSPSDTFCSVSATDTHYTFRSGSANDTDSHLPCRNSKFGGLPTVTVKLQLTREEENSPYFATPLFLREWFNFEACIRSSDPVPPQFLHDCYYAVFVSMSVLLSNFTPKNDLLRQIIGVHNISTSSQAKKPQLIQQLTSHCCGHKDCAVYIFKSRGKPRRLGHLKPKNAVSSSHAYRQYSWSSCTNVKINIIHLQCDEDDLRTKFTKLFEPLTVANATENCSGIFVENYGLNQRRYQSVHYPF
jgi:hypothetical protein